VTGPHQGRAPSTPRAARVLRLGTRGSALALIQSREVATALEATGAAVELVIVRTAGDDQAPDTAWGEGAFVGALEQGLLGGSIDLAVHSAKDVPTTVDPRLAIAAYRPRQDPRDALVCRERGGTIATLPHGARVGTDSPRRSAFLLARRPDLLVHPLNGNVDTRLRRLDSGESDALVLAVAGLTRLDRADRIDERIAPDVIPPAPGQGAVAVEVRADDDLALASVARLDDAPTRMCVEAERAFLHASGGGCRAPIGCLARIEGGGIVMRAGVSREPVGPGVPVAWREASGPVEDRVAIAEALAAGLRPMRGTDGPGAARRPTVLVTRPEDQAGTLVDALDARGIGSVVIPTISVEPADPAPMEAAARRLADFDWVVVTSPNGARALLAAAARAGADPGSARWAAVGSATALVLDPADVGPVFVPSRGTGAALGAELPVRPGERVLLARTDIADATLPDRLAAVGARVEEVVVYRTVEGPEASRRPLTDAVASGSVDVVVFTSGSTVRGLLALLPPDLAAVARAIPACCIGGPTTAVATAAGFSTIHTAPSPRVDAVADLVASTLPTGALR
jgi:hydroxymethylbilane synthase